MPSFNPTLASPFETDGITYKVRAEDARRMRKVVRSFEDARERVIKVQQKLMDDYEDSMDASLRGDTELNRAFGQLVDVLEENAQFFRQEL